MGRGPRAGAGRGTAFGIYNAVLGLGSLAASLLFGFIWTRVSPHAAFLTGAGFAARRDRAVILDVFLGRRDRWQSGPFTMKQILVTNDDGVHSEGIHALARALAAARRRHRRRAAYTRPAPSATR